MLEILERGDAERGGADYASPCKQLGAWLVGELVRSACQEGAAVAPGCNCAHHRLLPSPALQAPCKLSKGASKSDN